MHCDLSIAVCASKFLNCVNSGTCDVKPSLSEPIACKKPGSYLIGLIRDITCKGLRRRKPYFRPDDRNKMAK